MKRLPKFLLRLVIISLLFVPVLLPLHSAYKFVVALLSNTAIDSLPFDGSGYLYTFLILIIGVPELPTRKRIIAIVAGIFLFIGADYFMAGIWIPHLKPVRMTLGSMAVTYGYIVVVHYLLPFLLWLAFAFRQIEQLFRGEAVMAAKL